MAVEIVGQRVVDLRRVVGAIEFSHRAAVDEGHRRQRGGVGGFLAAGRGLGPQQLDRVTARRREHRFPCLDIHRVDIERATHQLILGRLLIGGGGGLAPAEQFALGGIDGLALGQIRFERLGGKRLAAVHEPGEDLVGCVR